MRTCIQLYEWRWSLCAKENRMGLSLAENLFIHDKSASPPSVIEIVVELFFFCRNNDNNNNNYARSDKWCGSHINGIFTLFSAFLSAPLYNIIYFNFTAKNKIKWNKSIISGIWFMSTNLAWSAIMLSILLYEVLWLQQIYAFDSIVRRIHHLCPIWPWENCFGPSRFKTAHCGYRSQFARYVHIK